MLFINKIHFILSAPAVVIEIPVVERPLARRELTRFNGGNGVIHLIEPCLLYTSDAADEL